MLPVTDDQRRLVGVIDLPDVVTASPQTRVDERLRPDTYSIRVDEDQEVAARLMQEADLVALPVPTDLPRVLQREVVVGLLLGLMLGVVAIPIVWCSSGSAGQDGPSSDHTCRGRKAVMTEPFEVRGAVPYVCCADPGAVSAWGQDLLGSSEPGRRTDGNGAVSALAT